jgi:hypothetical protein
MNRLSENDEIRMTNDELQFSAFVIRHSSFGRRRAGHSLMELVAAMVASAMLLAGLGSIMLIARQVAYTPMGATRRTESADVFSQLADELKHATVIIGQASNVLEFVVADRNADGTAEKIRYEWSGTSGQPLRKSINGGTAVTVLETITNFNATYLTKAQTTALTTTAESAEQTLAANLNVQSGTDLAISSTYFLAQQIDPTTFVSIPTDAVGWNATQVEFYGRKDASPGQTLILQLRPAGQPYDGPTSYVSGQVSWAESSLNSSNGWNTIPLSNPIRNLALHRKYALTWTQTGSGSAATILVNDSGAGGFLESSDAGASWQYMTTRQMAWRIRGKYLTPGTTHNVTRNFITHVLVKLQSGGMSHGRIDASVPLINSPELLSAYWRTDFDRNPTTTNGNGDSVADWALASGGSFDTATLASGVWYASGALETRPLHDFTQNTVVDVRCRNSTVGGNGSVVRINADRQGGLYAPILIYLQRQSDGTQTLSLNGKTSDAATKQLFSCTRLSGEFVRVRLIIVPQYDVVNIAINDEDQGTYSYPTYAPATSTDRYLTLYGDTSQAEFDYVDVRVAN